MKIILKYDPSDAEDRIEAKRILKASENEFKLWEIHQYLRGIHKHGFIGNQELSEKEYEIVNIIYEHIMELIKDED